MGSCRITEVLTLLLLIVLQSSRVWSAKYPGYYGRTADGDTNLIGGDRDKIRDEEQFRAWWSNEKELFQAWLKGGPTGDARKEDLHRSSTQEENELGLNPKFGEKLKKTVNLENSRDFINDVEEEGDYALRGKGNKRTRPVFDAAKWILGLGQSSLGGKWGKGGGSYKVPGTVADWGQGQPGSRLGPPWKPGSKGCGGGGCGGGGGGTGGFPNIWQGGIPIPSASNPKVICYDCVINARQRSFVDPSKVHMERREP